MSTFCFRLFFDDFHFFYFSEKGYWARSFEKTFWVVRGGPGGHLGASGGDPGGVLGGPGGVRGASWEGLGRSWGDLGATFTAVRYRIDFLIDFYREKGARRGHLGRQNGAKIDPKTMQIRSRFSRAKKTGLESVLGAS